MIEEEIGPIVLLTIKVSGTATLLSVIGGVPLGLWLALRDFRGKRFLSGLLNFGMGLGLVEPCTQSELYNLMMDIMPGTLSGENIDASMRDTLRAQRIQNVIE